MSQMTPQLYAILGVGLLLVVDAVLLVWINNRVKETNPDLKPIEDRLRTLDLGLDSIYSRVCAVEREDDSFRLELASVQKSITELHKFVTAPKPEAPKNKPIMARNWREVQTLVGTGEDDAS